MKIRIPRSTLAALLLLSTLNLQLSTLFSVANGVAVTRLNNLSDNVTLAAGANVTITPNGSTLTISSPTGGIGPWQLNGTNTFYNGGNVGIGTTNPAYPLHIAAAEPAMLLQDTGPNSTQTGYISFYNGNSTLTAWVGFGLATDPHFSVVNARSGGNIRFVTQFGERVTIVPGGNVGIGTDTPQVRLDVRGNVKMGTSGELFATGGDENLRIIRGTIAADGTRLQGSGFTSSRPFPGNYLITFTTPFAGTPTVTANLEYPGFDIFPTSLQPDALSAGSANIVIRYYENDSAFVLSREFHFIAVGPRN